MYDKFVIVRCLFCITAGVVSTSAVHNVDFDILTDISIEMYIMVTDGKEHDEKVLAIQIQNLNEPPSFSPTHYSVTRNEGNVCINYFYSKLNPIFIIFTRINSLDT